MSKALCAVTDDACPDPLWLTASSSLQSEGRAPAGIFQSNNSWRAIPLQTYRCDNWDADRESRGWWFAPTGDENILCIARLVSISPIISLWLMRLVTPSPPPIPHDPPSRLTGFCCGGGVNLRGLLRYGRPISIRSERTAGKLRGTFIRIPQYYLSLSPGKVSFP